MLSFGVVRREREDLFRRFFMLPDEHRQELLVVELVSVFEVGDDVGRGDGVAVNEDVEEIPHRHEVRGLERVTLLDQDLHEHFNRRPLPLKHARHGDERLDEGRREGKHVAKHLLVAAAGEERVHHALPHDRGQRHLREGGIELGFRRRALRLEDSLLGDHREVAVFERDHSEPVLIPLHKLAVVHLLGAGDVLADELAEVPLAGDEAHDRGGAVGVLAFDELGELGGLHLEELVVGSVGREPEEELVEKENQAVVAE